MRDIFTLFLHAIVTIIRLAQPGGLRAVYPRVKSSGNSKPHRSVNASNGDRHSSTSRQRSDCGSSFNPTDEAAYFSV
jgi:hypothetical protein